MTDMIAADHSGELSAAERRAVLRMVTYGLYAVGVAHGEDRNIFTANWLTQVSFDPPLIALSVQNDSHSIGLLAAAGAFAVAIFREDQVDIAGLLGKRWKVRPDKIEQVAYRIGVTGCPILKDGLGSFECRVVESTRAGDSTVFVGEIVHAEVYGEGTPLTMAAAGFRHAG